MDIKVLELLNKNCNKEKSLHSQSYVITVLNAKDSFWSIKEDCYTEFWKEYCEMIQTDGDYCLAERSNESPVTLEFNFGFLDPDETLDDFSEEFISKLVHTIIESLHFNLKIKEEEEEHKLLCCVLLSDHYDDKLKPETTMITMRVQFPYCNVSTGFQREHLRPYIINELRKRNVIRYLERQPTEDWDNIINPLVPYNYVPLYKSKSKLNIPYTKLHTIYHPTFDENGLLNVTELSEDIFDPLNHSGVQKSLIELDITENFECIEDLLPMILSVQYTSTITQADKKQKVQEKDNFNSIDFNREPNYKNPIEFVDLFVPMLSKDRFKSYLYCIDLGKAIYNATSGSDEGMDKWIKLCKCSDLTDEKCKVLYPSFKGSLVTYRTIAWYARIDNKNIYDKWYNDWCYKGIEKLAQKDKGLLNNMEIADAFYRFYWLDYAFSPVGKGNWYKFTCHHWKQMEDGTIELSDLLGKDFLDCVYNVRKEFQSSQEDTDRKAKYDSSLTKVISILCGSMKDRIIKECRARFYIEEFEKNLDCNPSLIGLLNGVIELTDKDATFRDGKPEDYIAMSTQQMFRKDFSSNSKPVKKYLDYLRQVFPDDELVHYIRKDISSMLKGRNSEKLFRVYSGGGDNSKSVYIKLLQKAFGSYCIDFPVSAITGKRGESGAASPQLARAKGAHIAIMSEPDDFEVIKAGLVKGLTGNDRFFARFLHDNGSEIEAMFKLILVCNKIPAIPNGGKAMKNRLRVIPFLASFRDEGVPATEEEQRRKRIFKKDEDFDKYIPELAQAMLWCSVRDYSGYCKEGLKEPDIIARETKSYWEDNDIYDLFIKECIVMVKDDEGNPDTNVSLLHGELYRVFKTWFREGFSGSRLPDSPVVKVEISNRLGNQVNRRWLGVSIKEDMIKL